MTRCKESRTLVSKERVPLFKVVTFGIPHGSCLSPQLFYYIYQRSTVSSEKGFSIHICEHYKFMGWFGSIAELLQLPRNELVLLENGLGTRKSLVVLSSLLKLSRLKLKRLVHPCHMQVESIYWSLYIKSSRFTLINILTGKTMPATIRKASTGIVIMRITSWYIPLEALRIYFSL